jgi:hypothetical protein
VEDKKMPIPLSAIDTIYGDLQKIDEVDAVTGAIYRERAQDIIATPSIALKIRKAIAERLIQANQELALETVTSEESY